MLHAMRDEALEPVTDRRGSNGQRRHTHLANAGAAALSTRPRKEGEDATRRPFAITIVEVIGARVVEVDRLLHQPHPEGASVEVDVLLRISGDGRDVMDAEGVAHWACGLGWLT